MNALMPKSWHRLPESEKKKIEEIKEAEIERRMLVIVDIILKMSCDSLNETEKMGEDRLSRYLGNFHHTFRQHAKLVKEGKQMDYLDEKMRKIFRKGEYPGKGWRDDWDAMARKTVYRKLIGKWGVMSITYQNAGEGAALAQQMRDEGYTDEPAPAFPDIEGEAIDIDPESGEVIAE